MIRSEKQFLYLTLITNAEPCISKKKLSKRGIVFKMEIEFSDITEAKKSIIDEFGLFENWVDRYEYIIELGQQLNGLPDNLHTEQNRVKGCQSQVWFEAKLKKGLIFFQADSDAMIVRGLIALLLRVYSGRTPREILDTPPDFFGKIELGSHLSGNRANGLHAMIIHIQGYAKSCICAEKTENQN